MAPASPTDLRPSRIRYLVLALTTIVAVILYLDRICLSFAERYVKEDLGISDAEMGLVLSSFFWAYALAQVPAGGLSDRFGARLMLVIYLAGWSAFTGFLGLAYGLATLIIMRLACGLFQAGAYPTSAALIGRWMPFHRRGFASGIVSLGGRLGGALAPILTAYLMVAFVPVSTSSLLKTDDLLDAKKKMDVRKLFPQYFSPASSPASAAKAPQDARRDEAKLELARTIFGRLPMDLRNPPYHASWEYIERLTKALNTILGQPDLIETVALTDFDLPEEAVHLATPSGAPRSQEQVERRNRLLLEAAFPDAIRKLYGNGWRPTMVVYGIAGLIVAAFFWWLYRDSPRRHPHCNAGEIALIEGEGGPIDPAAQPTPLPVVEIVKSTGLWISSAVQFLTNFGWVFLITWFPRYLQDVYKVPLVERGWMTSVPIFVGMAGMFVGGWLTDAMAVRLGPKWGRSAPVALSRFMVAGAFAVCIFLDAPWPATIALAIVALSTDLGTPALWAYSLDVGGKHVGAVLGWTNMFGNLGAAVSPIALNWIIGADRDYVSMFLACAAAFALAGILALFLDATKPVVAVHRLAAEGANRDNDGASERS